MDLSIASAGLARVERPPGFTTGWRALPWITVQAVVRGAYRVTHAGGEERLTDGALWFIPAGVRHRHDVAGGAPAEVAWWHGEVRWPGGLDAFAACGALRLWPDGLRTPLGRALLALFPRPPGDGLRARLASQARVAVLVAALAATVEEPPPPALAAQLAPVFRYIDANLHLPLRRGELAAQAGLAPSRFHQLFLAVTGSPPMQWVLRRRLERAAALLAGSDLGMAAIAERVGLCDAFHLNKRFRRRYGMPPSEFRRRGGGG